MKRPNYDGDNSGQQRRHVVMVSRVLWEQVVVPWVLAPARGALPWGEALPEAVAGCVFRVAEAAFPLVALCSRAVAETNAAACASRWAEWGRCSTVEAAAAAPSPRCVAWIVSPARRAASRNWDDEEGIMGAGERRKAREQIAVVCGLCCGGHLAMANRFVENNWEDQVMWPPPKNDRGTEKWLPNCSAETVIPAPGTVLFDEFYSERGISHIMRVVCLTGNLDAVKWILSRLLHVTEQNKMILKDFLHCAAYCGHVHILKWLVDTFNLGEASRDMSIETSFHVKNSASELRDCVETFPHWNWPPSSQVLAWTTAACKCSPANEIIEVCQWFKAKFSLSGADFITADVLPKHMEVIQWALSDVTDHYVLNEAWNGSCFQLGNVELGEWFIEKKGITPTSSNFKTACRGKHDNVAFVEWLSKKISVSGCLDDALRNALGSRNELISRWLEKCIVATTNSRPRVSLSSLGDWIAAVNVTLV